LGAGIPAPLPLGESGANSVKEGSSGAMPLMDAFDRGGAEPQRRGNMDDGGA
jgi:hypothetical protein